MGDVGEILVMAVWTILALWGVLAFFVHVFRDLWIDDRENP